MLNALLQMVRGKASTKTTVPVREEEDPRVTAIRQMAEGHRELAIEHVFAAQDEENLALACEAAGDSAGAAVHRANAQRHRTAKALAMAAVHRIAERADREAHNLHREAMGMKRIEHYA